MQNNSQKVSVSLTEIPKSVDNAFENLTNLPSKNIGQTLGDIWYLVFGGLSQMAAKKQIRYAAELEAYKAELEQAISNIPPENLTEPSIQITAQALENSKYCIEEPELRHMFASLITNTMNIDYQRLVHPSFAEIIKQMSPLDAQILSIFKKSPFELPICEYCRLTKSNNYVLLVPNVFMELSTDNCFTQAISISSLDRLGLVSVDMISQLADDFIYNKFKSHPLYLEYQNQYPNKVVIRKGIVKPTLLGSSFLKVCVPN